MKKKDCWEIINSLRDCSEYEINKRADRLSSMERTTLNHLFKAKDMTMADIAKYYGYSRTRIQQIRDKGLRKLREPSLCVTRDIYKHPCINDPIIALRLSTRTYNALERHNIKTIKDIINTPETEFKRMRNMGVKSYNELRSRMIEFGIWMGEYR